MLSYEFLKYYRTVVTVLNTYEYETRSVSGHVQCIVKTHVQF